MAPRYQNTPTCTQTGSPFTLAPQLQQRMQAGLHVCGVQGPQVTGVAAMQGQARMLSQQPCQFGQGFQAQQLPCTRAVL